MIYSSGILLNPNLVGYWPLNGDATDKKAGNDGTVVSGSFVTTVAIPIIGQSSSYASGYINIPHDNNYDFGTTTNFTIELWYYPTSLASQQNLIDHRASGADGWVVYSAGGGAGVATINLLAGSPFTSIALGSLNAWYHCIISVIRTTSVSIYLNAVVNTTASATTGYTASSAGQLTLGGRSFTQPSLIVAGNLANVAIYNYAMTAQEVAMHYNQFLDGMPTMPNVGIGKVL